MANSPRQPASEGRRGAGEEEERGWGLNAERGEEEREPKRKGVRVCVCVKGEEGGRGVYEREGSSAESHRLNSMHH